MLAHYEIVDSHILLSQIRKGTISDTDVRLYLRDVRERIVKFEQPFILIIDVSISEKLSAEQRLMMGGFLKQYESLLKEKLITLIYVVPTPLLQFVLNGIFLFKKPPVPYKVFNRVKEALNWSSNRLSL